MHLKNKIRIMLTLLCGFVITLVGTLVIFGWHTKNLSLIQIFPNFAPMQYNTALSFIVIGLGLCALIFNRFYLLTLFGVCAVLMGGATLFEYIFGTNLGIDELLLDSYLTVKTTHPGRMAPMTALCFVLSGIILLVGDRHRRIQISIAISVILLSVMSIFGYMTGVEGVYGWGNLTRMAIHTASCFFILGVGVMLLALSKEERARRDNFNLIPLTLSSAILVLTLLSSFGIRESGQVRNAEHFNRLVADTNNALIERYGLYQHSLLGGAGMFYASDHVSRLEWRTYVNALDIQNSLPGIAGLGFIASVSKEGLPNYLEAIIRDGAPDFKNYPETRHPDKFIITFIEPVDFNRKAIGLDVGFESNRRKAAEYSRDNGVPTLTKKIVLVQDGQKTPGFLLYVPIYETKTTPKTLETRKEFFKGWVYAPFIASAFMEGLSSKSQNQIKFEVYDGIEANEENLIYQSGATDDTSVTNTYSASTTVGLAESEWTINWHSTNKFVPVANQTLSLAILFFGSISSLTLYYIVLRLLHSKETISREVERQTHKLIESENRLQLVFDSAGEGIYGVDLNGYTQFANKAAEDLLGYRFEDLKDKPLSDSISKLNIGKEPYAERKSDFLSSIIDGEIRRSDTELFDRKDGSQLSVEYTSKPMINENNEIMGAVVVFRDITERKIAEADIKEANAELEEFAYRTSHDLRSPLVSSISLLKMAEKAIRKNDTDTAMASLSHTQNSLRKLETLVKDILSLTQTKNEDEELRPVDLNEVIHDSLEQLKNMENFERIEIKSDLRFTDPIFTMKNRVVLIVENMISNAVKYQDTTKDHSYLKISAFRSDNDLILTFRDNGVGVPKTQQDNIFQMFKRFHPKISFGSGLGLYMVKKSVSILGGNICFKDPGDGAQFEVTIPLPLDNCD